MSDRDTIPFPPSDFPDDPSSSNEESQASTAPTRPAGACIRDPFRYSMLKRCKELERVSRGLTNILSVLEFHGQDWEEAKDVHLLVDMAKAALDGIVRRIYIGPEWDRWTGLNTCAP